MKSKLVLSLTIFALAILLLLGLAFGFRYFIDRAITPLQNTSNTLSTQVAKVLHPTPTIKPDPVTIINAVSALARLETIQYSVEKIITAEIGQDIFRILFGDKLLFVAHGTVIAGIDLNKLQAEDIQIEGDLIVIDLPDPEVFVVDLDNEKSYVYDRQTGLLSRENITLETLARQAAEQEIYQAALKDGILEQAAINAQNYLALLLRDLGFQRVQFVPYDPPQLESD